MFDTVLFDRLVVWSKFVYFFYFYYFNLLYFALLPEISHYSSQHHTWYRLLISLSYLLLISANKAVIGTFVFNCLTGFVVFLSVIDNIEFFQHFRFVLLIFLVPWIHEFIHSNFFTCYFTLNCTQKLKSKFSQRNSE